MEEPKLASDTCNHRDPILVPSARLLMLKVNSNQTSHDDASLEEANSLLSCVGSRDVTPDTSLSERIKGGHSKKLRKGG